jgi:hypothetical protein
VDDLDEPVEDQKGYVYDKQGIYQYISSRGVPAGSAHAQVQCPVMGCNHMVSRATLKPCQRILRRRERQQRQQHWGGTQQQAQQAGDADEEVLEA